ncbi:MAG: metalloregulator ArsR/SmtB family transcription factor [Verrucomicrobiota bacterium]|nr:metalloregulator ArsR/SmtB family transcription factor [Verrucomicrobiota bacterium]
MSRGRRRAVGAARQLRLHAPIFAALGDETRLGLVARLCDQSPSSISELAEGSPITRQAITKHLQVLESVGVVRGEMAGRARLFELNLEPLLQVRDYLELVSAQWDDVLTRLKAHVERCE